LFFIDKSKKMKIYCYTGSKSSSTYYDAYFLAKYSTKYKYIISSKYAPPVNRKAVILFTDPGTYCQYHDGFKKYPNKFVCWWHGNASTPNRGVQKRIKIAKKWLPKCKGIIVSCDYGVNCVRSLGVPDHLINKIHLGVDMSLFKVLPNREEFRKNFKVPENSFCIGSFQRDTDKLGGPKTIKGPDIFIDVVSKLKKSIPNMFVLLSGRRRDYMKKHLKKLDIKYKHVYLDDYSDIVAMYNCLDCYLLTSREEGGPKALMESIACGIPIVSTKCGMAPDVIQNGKNGFMCCLKTNDLADSVLKVKNGEISGDITSTAKPFDYRKIVLEYDKLMGQCNG